VLEATIAGSFSRVGLAVRSRLLPEFSRDERPSLAHKVAIVTGATSGLGLATATELARLGGTVHLLGRDRDRAVRARAGIIAGTGNSSVSYGIADLTDAASVRAFARGFAAEHGRLDVLIHNAGAMYRNYQVNAAGLEMTFAGQVAGPFLLTTLLLPLLRLAAPARVIVVSSGGLYGQQLARSVTPMGPGEFLGVTAYARAKRAQVALSGEWARRTPVTEVAFHAMHPGWADTPGISASLPGFRGLAGPLLRTPAEGSDTIVWLATAAPDLLGSGKFWHDRRPRREYLLGRPPARQHELASALWETLAASTSAGGEYPDPGECSP
jgi:dehydrogenase/reductase SDR family member 12